MAAHQVVRFRPLTFQRNDSEDFSYSDSDDFSYSDSDDFSYSDSDDFSHSPACALQLAAVVPTCLHLSLQLAAVILKSDTRVEYFC